jgi:hypothetical protein
MYVLGIACRPISYFSLLLLIVAPTMKQLISCRLKVAGGEKRGERKNKGCSVAQKNAKLLLSSSTPCRNIVRVYSSKKK